jgi:hypothetical protein
MGENWNLNLLHMSVALVCWLAKNPILDLSLHILSLAEEQPVVAVLLVAEVLQQDLELRNPEGRQIPVAEALVVGHIED